MSTNAGVSRYDGYSFTNFTTEEGLPDNVIYRLFEDSEGRIWFLTNNGKTGFYKKGEFYNGKNLPILKEMDFNSMILSAHEDYSGNIRFCGIYDVGKMINSGLSKVNSFKTLNYTQTFFEIKGEIWSVSFEGFLNLKTREFYPLNYFGKAHKGGRSRVYLDGKNILIGSENAIYSYHLPGETGEDKIIDTVNGTINFITKSEEQIITCGTNGITFVSENKNVRQKRLFKDKQISSLVIDHEGSYWISTLGDGIYHIPDMNIFRYDSRSGLTQDYVSKVNGLDNSHIIAGHSKNELSIIENKKSEKLFHQYNSIGEGLIMI